MCYNVDMQDIRWQQRFSNYKNALKKLGIAVRIVKSQKASAESSTDLEELSHEGLIQRFEYTQELAWKVIKDYAEYQGTNDIDGSRDAIRYAFSIQLIDDKRWMDTIADRNRTSHIYDEETVNTIMTAIIDVYYPLFLEFEKI